MNTRTLAVALLLAGFLISLRLDAQIAPGDLSAPTELGEPQPSDVGTVTGCGTSFGTRFNLEPRTNARPQNTTTIDVLRNRAAAGVDLVVGGATDYRGFGPVEDSMTGYYVSRDADCVPEFEGRLPPLPDPLEADDTLFGKGAPVAAADLARDALFMADVRSDSSSSGIGLFRTTAATLLNPTACPNGTHTQAQAATCWPTKRMVLSDASFARVYEPHLAVDERASGTGAGDVYSAASIFFTSGNEGLALVACTNTLAACSAPLGIYGTPAHPVIKAHVAIRPDGRITITWIVWDSSEDNATVVIRYSSCAPAGAPAPPTCGAPSFGHVETQSLFTHPTAASVRTRLAAQDFGITTHPQHAHRVDANGTETYVVWDRCKVPVPFGPTGVCPDADVVLKASNNDGATWSALTCLSCFAQDQFFPAIRADRSRNIITIAYYANGGDATFQHRVQVLLRHINPGGTTPDPSDVHTITTLLNDPSGDPLLGGTDFGGYIAVATRGTGADGQSRAYVHYTYNNIQGTLSGVQVPEQNNHLSRLDY
jgi:hypothetical protein